MIEKDADGFILNGCYHVPFADCDTTEKIVLRTAEIIRQPWSSTAYIHAFIAAASEHIGDDAKPAA